MPPRCCPGSARSRDSSIWRAAGIAPDAPAPLWRRPSTSCSRAVFAEEDQPQRRARLPRHRAGRGARSRDAAASLTPDDEDETCRAGRRRSAITTEAGGKLQRAGCSTAKNDEIRYTKYVPNLLDELDMDELIVEAVRPADVERVRQPMRHRTTTAIARCRRCTTRSSMRCSTAGAARRNARALLGDPPTPTRRCAISSSELIQQIIEQMKE